MRFVFGLCVVALLGCGGEALEPTANDAGWQSPLPEDDAGTGGGGGASPDAGVPVDAGAPDAGPPPDAGPATSRGASARDLVADGGRLVDVRTESEFAAGHLAGARNIPLGTLAARASELEPKDEWVVVYCRSGSRSAQAAGLLADGGFARVFDLGAMSNW